jgi:hypothetical protein
MLSVHTVSFDTIGLHLQSETASERRWSTRDGQPIALEIKGGPSPFLVLLQAPEPIAAFRRVAAQSARGLVDFSPQQLDGWVLIRLVTKGVLYPETGWGRSYLGLITIPFRDGSLILRTEAHETGLTGLRENTIMGDVLSAGAVRLKDSARERHTNPMHVFGPGDFEGWMSDPSDQTAPHLARSVAEDPQYDARFPDHPLSRVRRILDQVQQSIRLEAEARPLPSFNSVTSKRWWRFWRQEV